MKRETALTGVLVACTATPAWAQTLGQGASDDIPWLRLASGLLLCIALAVVAVFALRQRLGGQVPKPKGASRLAALMTPWRGLTASGSSSRITHIETRRLSSQVMVTVFKCDSRDYMVTSSLQGRLVVMRLDDEALHRAEA